MSCLHYFEKYLNINSVVHRTNPSVKIIIVILYILVLVLTPSVKNIQILLFGIPVFLFILLSKVPLLYIFSRSLVIIPFSLFLSISMAFYIPGHVLMKFHILHFNAAITLEGIQELAGVLLKSYFSVLPMIVLTSTTSFPALMRGFRILYIPKTLIVIIGFMYRYITVLAEEALIMLRARDCRYFGGFSPRQIKVTGNMVAILFIRTLERSERIYSSMISRGYDGEIRTIKRDVFTWHDIIFAVVSIILILTVKVAAYQWKNMQ